MKIRITRGAGWYKEAVGAVFEVISQDINDSTLEEIYFIDPKWKAGTEDGRRYVSASNCEMVGEEEETTGIDMVETPPHYRQGRTEVIDIIEDATQGAEGIEAVCQANVIKYIMRYRHKNGVEDVQKAIWYAKKLAEVLEESEREA